MRAIRCPRNRKEIYTAMQSTLQGFGYPDSLVREYEHWLVLLRPTQTTLGSLVLIERSGATRFSEISDGAFQEYGHIVKQIERVLQSLFQYDKINYLMLMMVDPEVHFHVIPRYASPREFNEVAFLDSGWPALPNLGEANNIPEDLFLELADHVKRGFEAHG